MKILLFGGSGQVGREIIHQARASSISINAPGSTLVDITDPDAVKKVVTDYAPELIVNTAAYTAVDRAESEQAAAMAVNRDGAGCIAQACAQMNIPLIHVSTDYVFDGEQQDSYLETDTPHPINVYGESKWQGELAVQDALQQHIILRTSWVFGQYGNNFVKTMLRLGGERDELSIVDDQVGCPTPAASIAETLLLLSQKILQQYSRDWGIYHYCGSPEISWFGFAQAIFKMASESGMEKIPVLTPIPTSEFPTPAQRPRQTVLDCDKIRRVFNIEPVDWHDELRKVISAVNQ